MTDADAATPQPPVGGWKVSSNWRIADVFALEAMRPLGEAFLPWSAYALSPSALLKVLTLAEFYRPRVIVELGAGLSTVYLARFLRYRDFARSRLISVEHDAAWLGMVAEYLEREGLEEHAELLEARRLPWVPRENDGDPSQNGWSFELPDRWYSSDAIRDALGRDTIDMLVIDGPKGKGTITRYPALIELRDHLSEQPTVILDDAGRPPEQEILARWSKLSDIEFGMAKGDDIAIGRRPRST